MNNYFRAEVAQLKREKKEVETDLRLIDSLSNQNRDDRNIGELGDLGSEKCKYTATHICSYFRKFTTKTFVRLIYLVIV